MSVKQLDGLLFCQMVLHGAERLRQNMETVNQLNVFPIPDGDTGDNMFATLSGGVAAAKEKPESLALAANGIADGMLLSARGNSGVILSQFFAGIADGLKGCATADSAQLAAAFQAGVKQAYGAVSVPTEGTLLTVMREAADHVAALPDTDLNGLLEAFVHRATCSVENTPNLLPVLKEAGVVDSGGVGLLYIAEGMLAALNGEPLLAPALSNSTEKAPVDLNGFTADSVLTFGYCTEFLLRLQTCKISVPDFDINGLIAHLQSLGDSIVAVQNGSIVKIHIHTMTPGEVLNFCQQFGEFLTLKVENMSLQHSGATVQNRFTVEKPQKTHQRCAAVAVASGEGIQQLMLDYGADRMIDGGQSMNPSTEDFLKAFEALSAEMIVVLPNNSNVILAARQAADLYQAATVRVLETKTVGDGIAALSMMDKEADDLNAMLEEMAQAFQNVQTAMISRSVRAARMKNITIAAGDYIGFIGKDILVSRPDKITAAKEMLSLAAQNGGDVFMILRGQTATAEELGAVAGFAREHYPNMEVYEINGQQELYDFIIICQ